MGRGQKESSALSPQKKASSYFTQSQRAMPAFEPGYFPLFGGRGLRGCSQGFWQRVGNLTHPLPAHSPHPKARTAFQRARTKGAQKRLEERGCVPHLAKRAGTAGGGSLERSELLRKQPGRQGSSRGGRGAGAAARPRTVPVPVPVPAPGPRRTKAPPAPLTYHQELASATGEVQLQRSAAARASLGPLMVGCGGSPRRAGRRDGAPCGEAPRGALERGLRAAGARRARPGCRPLPPRRTLPRPPPPGGSGGPCLLPPPAPGQGPRCRGCAEPPCPAGAAHGAAGLLSPSRPEGRPRLWCAPGPVVPEPRGRRCAGPAGLIKAPPPL